MPLYCFLAFICLATVTTLDKWRLGMTMFITAGMLQDPIRKITPGTPPYLVLSTTPIWIAMIIGAFSKEKSPWQNFQHHYARLSSSISLFCVALIPAAYISTTYGAGGWQMVLIGSLSYFGAILSLLTGFCYMKKSDDLLKLFKVYCIAASILLLGSPLEYVGMLPSWNAIGTKTLGTQWVRTFPGYTLRMISGFFRSPDVMGWHAVALAMLAITIGLKEKGMTRFYWLALAGWGGLGAMLCGRRKMIFMLPIFMIVVFWVNWRRRGGRVGQVLTILVTSSVIGYYIYQEFGPNEGVQEYYSTQTRREFKERVLSETFANLQSTYDQNGFWGSGLGSASQGRQHLNIKGPRAWQEGGLDRLLAELGVLGLGTGLVLGLVLLQSIIQTILKIQIQSDELPLFAGLSGFVLGNAGSFIVSHQIFGDPFINCFFSFMTGALLSMVRNKEFVLSTNPTIIPPSLAPLN